MRLFFLQVSRADEFGETAERQHAIFISSLPARGNIFFKDKDGSLVPAAVNRKTYALAGNPGKITAPAEAFGLLEKIMPISRDEFLPRAAGTSTYTIFQKDISKEISTEIARLEIPGVWIEENEQRVYPEGPVASQALGFVGFTDNTRVGRYGIEQQYEKLLSGVADTPKTGAKQKGAFFSFADIFRSKKQDGEDIILTLDPHIQSIAHRVVGHLMEQWHATSAGVLVLDPQTGAILAIESAPDFDPNAYNMVTDYDVFLNPFTQKVYEMGSIMKPLTMAAGLDAYAITEDTTYYDAGFVQIRDARIENYDGKGRGRQTMYDILDQSLNTGAVFVMQQLGARQFRDYMDRFGLGSITGIDLPQEIAGNMTNLEHGGEVEYATASFGQGIAVTPIALAAALSSVANGGELVRPHMTVSEYTSVTPKRVLRQETSEMVSRMLSKVVDDTLAGGLVALPDYHIAAKTGTAQIPNSDDSGYSDYYLHTFFGYAPAFDPRFLILLFLEKPVGARYASQTLAEPFRELTEFIIHYYEIPPDR
ncbi:MAG: Uncharacterized protein G01um101466_349 [Parcubacteria group bacterium Gr01-1014_66]|nr:MAG: Uncharacterized protein G01um101466_349 [Parcubacteria group bacterium Gr01-1014_66]